MHDRTLAALIPALTGRRVLIVGDIMLDEYVWGDVRRISPEAPVPVVHRLRETYRPGGAGNVAANVAALGGAPLLVGVVGADAMAQMLAASLRGLGVDGVDGLLAAPDRPTTVKSRIMGHNQQMLRVDTETTAPISAALVDQTLAWCQTQIEQADACLLSDYAKGMLTPDLCQGVIALARGRGLPVVVDPKGRDFHKYSGATVMTPNLAETATAAGREDSFNDARFDIGAAVATLRRQVGEMVLLVTRGADGMTLFDREGAPLHIPAAARTVYDVTGAGDTVAATVSLALAAGASLPQAARLASMAAGIVVGKLGTATASQEELAMGATQGGREQASSRGSARGGAMQ